VLVHETPLQQREDTFGWLLTQSKDGQSISHFWDGRIIPYACRIGILDVIMNQRG